jgi:hypothetical protein
MEKEIKQQITLLDGGISGLSRKLQRARFFFWILI